MPESSKVKVEADYQNRGTPYRTCSIAVYEDDLDVKQMDKVRFALSRIVSSPEVSIIATGKPTPLDPRRFVRLRMVYYGEQLAADSIEAAISAVL